MLLVLLITLGLVGLVGALTFVAVKFLKLALRDPCPCDGCRGYMVYDHDEVRDGVTMAVWLCSDCAEVVMFEVPSSQPHVA